MQTARSRSSESGYTLAEALVTVTIIGLISGVSVPFFMNYLRANRIRSSASYFETALRSARQRAVTKHIQTRVSFVVNKDPGQYTIWEGTEDTDGNLTGWKAVQPTVRYLDQGVTFANDASDPVADNYDGSGASTAATDGKPDIIFGIDGSAINSADPALSPGTFWLKTNF
ncbi:MAG TPA: GspH/FimT family pseudopilin, partial [Thermoanaerobaculia bacterium]